MSGIVRYTRSLIAVAFVAFAASPAAAAMMVFDCIPQGDSTTCTLVGAHLTVEVLNTGGGQAAFVIVNEDAGETIVEQVYVADSRGTLVGPPEILNDAPKVVFEQVSDRRELAGAAGAHPPFESTADLSVTALQPSDDLGINPGESLGLVYAIAPGRTIADVLADLSAGHLRFGVSTVAVSGGERGSLVSQARLSEGP